MNYEQLKSVLNSDVALQKVYDILTSQMRRIELDKYRKQWNPATHNVMNRLKRKDKTINYEESVDDGEGGTKLIVKQRTEYVGRIPVPMQKNIVVKAVTFLFGNPVIIKAATNNDKMSEKALAGCKKVLEDNKMDSTNRIIAKSLFKSTQVAEIWYTDEAEEAHDDYGFTTKVKLRVSVFSPWEGNVLYPFFDDNGNLIAFSREYLSKDEQNRDILRLEVHTADDYRIYTQSTAAGWILESIKVNEIRKIPVVFGEQESAEWEDVQAAIERLEVILSNHADVNDYNGSPTILASGDILSFGAKGESGRVIEMGKDADMKYLSWDGAPESIRMEIENLFKIILTYTQTPDISFEAIKGIGAISGIALKFMFMDAHLKVMDKREIFDPYLKRRMNIIKSHLSYLNDDYKAVLKKMNFESIITPYTVEDIAERINMLVNASGGKALISQQSAVERAGLVDDTVKELDLIKAEQKEEREQAASESVIF